MHISHCALGCLATATDVFFGGYAFEIDVPAVELALSHDELGSDGSRSSLDGGSYGLSDLFLCGFFSCLCHDFEVFEGLNCEPRLLIFTLQSSG